MASNRKLTYGKTSQGLDLLPESGKEIISATSQVDALRGIKSPAGYEKTDGILSYNIICVISGGTVRERTFLNEVEKKRSFKSLDVIFVSTEEGGGGLTPRMMQEAYEDIRNDGFVKALGRNVQLDEVDSVYMFTDVDHYEDELRMILQNKADNTPVWIISNPDFEIWLYYCYRNNPEEDLVDVLNVKPSQRSKKLKRVNARFNNGGGFDTRKAFERLKDGIEHSREHYQVDDAGIPALLSTQMHIFAEDVLVKLGDEYENHLKQVREFREKMRKN